MSAIPGSGLGQSLVGARSVDPLTRFRDEYRARCGAVGVSAALLRLTWRYLSDRLQTRAEQRQTARSRMLTRCLNRWVMVVHEEMQRRGMSDD